MWIMEQRLMRRPPVGVATAHRPHVVAVPGCAVAGLCRFRVRRLAEMFEEPGVKMADRGNVQTIQPDHRGAGVIAVIMPLPVRCQHKVEWAHHHLLAIDSRVGSISFQYEAEGAWRMAMAGSHFSRKDQLQP